MIKSQCTYFYRPVVTGLLINVNFEDLLSDDVERFTAVHSTEFVSERCSTLCCCAIVLDINVLALPVEAHTVTNKPNQRESPLLLWENSLESVTRKKTFSTISSRSIRKHDSLNENLTWGPADTLKSGMHPQQMAWLTSKTYKDAHAQSIEADFAPRGAICGQYQYHPRTHAHARPSDIRRGMPVWWQNWAWQTIWRQDVERTRWRNLRSPLSVPLSFMFLVGWLIDWFFFWKLNK